MNAAPSMLDDLPDPPGSPLFWPGDAEDYEPPAQLVTGLLPKCGIGLVYGPPNCGKTAFTFDIAANIARGIAWRGRTIPDGGGLVLYVAGENPGSAKLRLKAYCRANPDAFEMPLAIYANPLNVANAGSVAGLIEWIRAGEAKTGRACVTVIVDTLATAMSGLDENSVKEMNLAIAGLAQIRDAIDGLVIAVHHSGKDAEKGARGSSALRAAVDVEIAVTGVSGTRTASVVKQRDLPTGGTFDFTLDPVTVGFHPVTNETITAIVVKHGDESTVTAKRRPTGKATNAILNGMGAGEADKVWTRDELRIAAAAGGVIHRNSVSDAIARLLKADFIQMELGGYRMTAGSL